MPLRFHFNTYHGAYNALADVMNIGRTEAAINYAARNGADVVFVMQLLDDYDPGIHAAVQFARHMGCLLTNAGAGAGDSMDAFPRFPASWPEVLTTGRSDRTESPGTYMKGVYPFLTQVTYEEAFEPSSWGWCLDVMVPSAGEINDITKWAIIGPTIGGDNGAILMNGRTTTTRRQASLPRIPNWRAQPPSF